MSPTQEPETPGNDDGKPAQVTAAEKARNGTIIAATITAVAGLIGVLITASGNHPPEPPAPPYRSTTPSTSVFYPPTSATTVSSTQPSLTQDPGGTGIAPPDFNNAATDTIPILVATMLPQQYDVSGVIFHRTTGSVQPCPIGNEALDVADTLRNSGCTKEVVGTYLDSSMQIQVTVWVVPTVDSTHAEAVFEALDGTPHDWGIWCPVNGVGSQVCQGQWRSAEFEGEVGYCHRYVMHARALYVDLRSDGSSLPALNSAAIAANNVIGDRNIPAAQC